MALHPAAGGNHPGNDAADDGVHRPTPIGSFVYGAPRPTTSQAAFPRWDLLAVEDADTGGMDWLMCAMQPK